MKLSYKNFRCPIFSCFRKKDKKVEMPTCNTSYWKENLVFLSFSLSPPSPTSFSSCCSLSFTNYAEIVFFPLLRDHFYFKASSYELELCDFPWNKKHVEWNKNLFISFFFFSKLLEMDKNSREQNAHNFQILLKKGLNRSFKWCRISSFKFI